MSFRRRIMNSNKEFTLSSNNDSVSPAKGTKSIYVYLGDELLKDESLIVNNTTGQVTSASYNYQTGSVSINYKSNTSTSSFKYGSVDITYNGSTKTYSFTQAKDYVTSTYYEKDIEGSSGYLAEPHWTKKSTNSGININTYRGTSTQCTSVITNAILIVGYCMRRQVTVYASGNNSYGSEQLMSESVYKEGEYESGYRFHVLNLSGYWHSGPYNFNNNILNLTQSGSVTRAGKTFSYDVSLTLNSSAKTYSITVSNLSYAGTIKYGSLPGSKTGSGTWKP